MPTAFKPPATTRRYDACVLGSGVGAVAAGALLARRGFRVLLVETAEGSGERLEDGWLLPAAPSLVPSPRLVPAAASVLGDLGLASDAARTLEPLAPALQLLLPRQRVELAREPERLAAELRREWPGDAPALVAALASLAEASEVAGGFLDAAPPLPPAGFFDRRALRHALKAAARTAPRGGRAIAEGSPLAPLGDHPLATALAAAARFLGRLEGPLAPLAAARLCGLALRGLHRPATGLPTLGEALRRRITEARGEILGAPGAPARIEALVAEGGRLAGLRVAGAADLHLARAFVLGAPAAWLARHLPAPLAARRPARALAGAGTGRRLAGLHLVLDLAAIPPGLGPAALALPAGAPADDAILVEVLPARRDGRGGAAEAIPTARLVTAWALVGAGEDGAAATARARAALAEYLPFHERHVRCESVAAPVPFLISPPGAPSLGVGGFPVRTGWRNLFLASEEVLPGLGFEGEIYAGLGAALHAVRHLGERERRR